MLLVMVELACLINNSLSPGCYCCSNGHMMTHRSKKPFECKFEGCDKSYCDARSLRRHLENHHQVSNNQQAGDGYQGGEAGGAAASGQVNSYIFYTITVTLGADIVKILLSFLIQASRLLHEQQMVLCLLKKVIH